MPIGRKRWRETEPRRDRRTGRFVHAPTGSKAVEALKATARRLMDTEDRRGPRLRWGTKGTARWWYIPRGGAVYWVRREAQPTMIRGFYYVPGKWQPVVPPRALWNGPRDFDAPAGTPLTSHVPKDVRLAAEHDAAGRQVEDRSARSDAFDTRRHRSGLHPNYGKARGLKTTRPARRKAR